MSDEAETMSVEQQAEHDQIHALIRDLAAHVTSLHAHAARGAIRVACTYQIGDAELLIGVEDSRRGQVVAILDGTERHVYVIPADALAVSSLSAPDFDHDDAETALADLLDRLANDPDQ